MTRSDIDLKLGKLYNMNCRDKDDLIIALCEKIDNVYENVLFPIENDGKFASIAEVLRKALEK
jgi:hypothetical protein